MSGGGDSKGFSVKKNHRAAIADLMTVKVYEVVERVLCQPQECIRTQEVTLLDDPLGSFEVNKDVCSGLRRVNGMDFFLYQATLKISATPTCAGDEAQPGLFCFLLLGSNLVAWGVSHKASN